MSFKEIKELRQTGKLEEALQMANQALEKEPNNIWNKRAAAWVYYDYLKKYAHLETFEEFKEYLLKIKDLELPEDEKMIIDNCSWQICKIVFTLQKSEHVDYSKVNALFEIIKDFHFTKPSQTYSFIYKAFHKGYENKSNYLSFADWWNFENFLPEDFLKVEFNGTKIMSIAEQAYIAYSKKLLEGEPQDENGQRRVVDKEKIQSFLPKLDSLIEEHPEYQYPQYFKAKLLLAIGDDENVLSAFLPFAKQKRNDFWIWELMAEIFSEDKDMQFACYCKALSLKTGDEFLVKIREKFAKILVEMGLFNEAKTEFFNVFVTLSKNGWITQAKANQWINEDWYKSATIKPNNQDLYSLHIKKAEEVLFQNIEEELIAVEFVNESKKILYFVKNEHKFGFFNYLGHISTPKIGDLLLVRFHKEGQDGFYKIYSAENAEIGATSSAIKTFKGNLMIIPPQNFGFINDVYIEPKIIEQKVYQNGQMLNGRAILSFNRKKNEWGWKAIVIN